MPKRGRPFATSDSLAVLLIVILWFRAVGARIALSLTADKVFVPVGQEPIWTPAASAVSRLSFLLAVGISVGIILFRINDVTRPGLWRVVVLLAPWLAIMLRQMYSGMPTSDSVLYVVVVLALAGLRPRPRVLIAVGALVVLTAIIAIGLGFLLPDAGLVRDADGVLRDRPDKAVFPSLGLLQGMFTAENGLGLYLSIGIATVAILPRWWLRFPGLTIVGFALLWSSARNSMLAAACLLLVGIVVWIIAGFGWRRAASAVARSAIGAAIVIMCVLPLMKWDEEAYTGRGLIWSGSLAEWSSRGFLFGLGRDWYEHVAQSDTSPLSSGAFQGHNQFIQWLTTGGVVLALLAVGSFLIQTYAITVPTSRYLVVAAMLATGIVVSGWLEVPLGFIEKGEFYTVTIVPLTVLFLARPGDTDRKADPLLNNETTDPVASMSGGSFDGGVRHSLDRGVRHS